MKKKRIISIVLTLILFLGIDLCFRPHDFPIVEEDFEIVAVRMGTELEDVTDQVNVETLEAMLSMFSRKGLPKTKTELRLTEDTVSISGTGGRYVEFSENGCVTYDSGSRYHYEIRDGGLLWYQILMHMPE